MIRPYDGRPREGTDAARRRREARSTQIREACGGETRGAAADPAGPARAPARRWDRVIRVRARGAQPQEHRRGDPRTARGDDGPVGSGKSSLAFDTIFAEGQRKYMESLSAYARQFLDQLKKPDVEEVEGIPPTIAIEQRSASANPRSTVATTTEIYDYLRLLFARCGTPRSWAVTRAKKDGTVLARSGAAISATSSTQIVDAVMGWLGAGSAALRPRSESGPEGRSAGVRPGRPCRCRHPPARAGPGGGGQGFHKEVLEDLLRQGWGRARVNGSVVERASAEGGRRESAGPWPLREAQHRRGDRSDRAPPRRPAAAGRGDRDGR